MRFHTSDGQLHSIRGSLHDRGRRWLVLAVDNFIDLADLELEVRITHVFDPRVKVRRSFPLTLSELFVIGHLGLIIDELLLGFGIRRYAKSSAIG